MLKTHHPFQSSFPQLKGWSHLLHAIFMSMHNFNWTESRKRWNWIQEDIWKNRKWKSLSCIRLFATPWTIHGILQTAYWNGQLFPSPGDLPNQGMESRSPTLQADSLPSEPPGKPKNIGAGSQSPFQGIFLTQEPNWGLLHCRRILYQLSWYGQTQYSLEVALLTIHTLNYTAEAVIYGAYAGLWQKGEKVIY